MFMLKFMISVMGISLAKKGRCSSMMFGCVKCACARCAEVDSSVKSYE